MYRSSFQAKLRGAVLSFLVLAALATLASACSDDDGTRATPATTKAITSFVLRAADNPGLGRDVQGSIVGPSIMLTVPTGTDVAALRPTIAHTGQSVAPASGAAQNFTRPVTYTVTAADGTTAVYMVTVWSPEAAVNEEITQLQVPDLPGAQATITGTSISLTVPAGTDITALRVLFSYTGANISPANGSVIDFSQPVQYTVTSADGTRTTYTVVVNVAPSSAKDITQLELGTVAATISGTDVVVMMPYGTDVTRLEPRIVHSGASITPASGEPRDFSQPVSYVVTAADGSIKTYSVRVIVAPSDSKEITRFTVLGRDATLNNAVITLSVPFGTDVTQLVPSIAHTGATIQPAADVPTNFTSPVEYTVTADDDSTHVYTVTVSVEASSAKEITSFTVLGLSGQIVGDGISLTVPAGTDLGALTPVVTHTGQSITPASGAAADFSAPVTYTVVAADGSMRSYTVQIAVSASDAKAITGFSILGIEGQISGDDIGLTVPYGTSLSALTPTITHTGVSVETPSGAPRSFAEPVQFVVTAQDGSTRSYTVTVAVAANDARDIASFSILGVPGTISGSAISLTLPYGTDVSALAPSLTITGASVSPISGAAQSFASPVSYTVTAEDGSSKTYVVSVNVAPNTAKDITSFSVLGVPGTISGTAISVTVPFGSDLTALVPTLTITGSSVSPTSGSTQNFSNPVVYTVTAEDQSTKAYTVAVSVSPNTAKDITAFSMLGVPATISGTNIALTVPYGTNVASLAPTLSITGQSVSPASGAAQDFSNPVAYTVTAQDGSTKVYTVSVSSALNTAKDITAFNILGVPGTISGSHIALTVPYGADLTALTPALTITGQTVSPASGAAQNFSSPVTYTVSAQDGSTRSYTVSVSVALNTAKDITAFSILGVPATISGNNIALTLPYGTDLTALAPTLTVTGQTVSPASGATANFTSPTLYIVSAQDGSTKSYRVTVSVAQNTAKDITAFSILGVPGTISGNNIALTLPYGTDVSALTPSLTITGQTVSPASGSARNFSSPVTYTVTAQDGSTKVYTVTVSVALNSAKDITAFSILGVPATGSGNNIALTVPFGTDLRSLTPTLSITGTSVSPTSGSAQNFSAPVTYTVTAQDGSTKVYTVTVGAAPNTAKDITAFSILGVPGTIGGNSIALTVPFGTNLASLTPSLTITGQSVSPASGGAQNFTSPVPYTVTAQDGSTKVYTVSVSVAQNTAKDITAFSILGVPGTISGTNIALTVPFGTNVSSLTPTLTITGSSVSPSSGAAQNFTSPVTYTVTAQNGSTKAYTVSVSVAQNTAKDIAAFDILGVPGTISGTNIALTLPFGTNVTSLTPNLTITGQSVSPANGVAQNFIAPVTYTVTAQNGSTKAYTVSVSVALNSAKTITGFSILGVPGTISGNNIALTVPYGTDVTALAPSLATTGQTVSPAAGATQNFSAPVAYTVTAQDGSTRVYTVTVGVAQNTAKDITAFSILGVPGTISGNNIALTLPNGTDVTALTPTLTITGSSVSPSSGNTQNFSNPVTYTVTAQNGSTKSYVVTVSTALNTSKDITGFSILGVPGVISGTNIALTVPYGTDVTSLTPSLTITGHTVSPANNVARNFSSPVTYTVTAQNGSTKSYTVTVGVALNAAKDITAFSILGVPGTISGTSIALTVPYGTDPTSLTPTLTITGQTVSPADNVTQDFSSPVTYTVTAQNGTTKAYTVTVGVALNSAKDITAFSILGVPGSVGANTISVTVPYGTDVTSLTPSATITGSSLSPTSGSTLNFTSPVTYTVTAQDGSTKSYTVSVTVALNTAKDITAFSILGVPGTITGTNIAVTVPYGTDPSSLTPTLTITGQTVSPADNVTQNFSSPVTYTVTAQDGTTQAYTVTVTVALNAAKDITAFGILGIAGTITGTNIGVTVPYGTDVTALTPTTLTITGQSVSPANGVAQNFTSPVTYTVTAQNGSTKAYTVTVTVAPPYVDCAAIKTANAASASGTYTIDPDGNGAISPFTAYCDMTNYGGGWTLIGKSAAGDYTSLTDTQFINLIANPTTDVNPSLLQSAAVPATGQMAFYNRVKTNALYHASGTLRAVRVDMSNHVLTPANNNVYFQQRVSAPGNWDFWAAMRNGLLWNRDGSGDATTVAYFGVDFVLSGQSSDFNTTTNVVTHRGDGSFGYFGTTTYTLSDGSTFTASRHFGLLGDGYGNQGYQWLFTGAPIAAETRWKNDVQSLQKSLIWLR